MTQRYLKIRSKGHSEGLFRVPTFSTSILREALEELVFISFVSFEPQKECDSVPAQTRIIAHLPAGIHQLFPSFSKYGGYFYIKGGVIKKADHGIKWIYFPYCINLVIVQTRSLKPQERKRPGRRTGVWDLKRKGGGKRSNKGGSWRSQSGSVIFNDQITGGQAGFNRSLLLNDLTGSQILKTPQLRMKRVGSAWLYLILGSWN